MSLPRKRVDWKSYDTFEGSDAAFARSIGMDPRNFHQYKKSRHLDEPTIVDVPVETVELTPTSTSADDTALHSAEDSAEDSADLPSVPDHRDIPTTTVQGYALDSADTWADHETRLQMLEGFVAALQAQARQPAVQQITVQPRSALPSAASVQTWEDPEDSKPERWNLWLPRGLKRRIEAQAKAASIAPVHWCSGYCWRPSTDRRCTMPDTTMQHAALMCWTMGFHPIPTLDGDKKAAFEWARYQQNRPTQAEIRKWWLPGTKRNLALVLGPIPRILVVNINQKHGDDGLSTLRREGWTLPATPTILTAHDGFAYGFKPPDRERYPFLFKTHQRLRDYPGIELRGAGGYQLLPPSTLDATARDPAGGYRWAEPWTLTQLFTDLAELPDWLIDLWITCDRTPDLAPTTGVKRAARRQLHTVVVSKDATTVCSGDTTTVCNQVAEGSGDTTTVCSRPEPVAGGLVSLGWRRCCATGRRWKRVPCSVAGVSAGAISRVHCQGMLRRNLARASPGMTTGIRLSRLAQAQRQGILDTLRGVRRGCQWPLSHR